MKHKNTVATALEAIKEVIKYQEFPPLYHSSFEWALDFFANLSWTPEVMVQEVNYILNNHSDLLQELKKAVNYDLELELKQVVRDFENGEI